jgi:hypothetical protein
MRAVFFYVAAAAFCLSGTDGRAVALDARAGQFAS